MEKKICFYEILGINKSATQDQVKKAYRKLAVKWHPDKNLDNQQQAKEKFRNISQAYQHLSDKEKRRDYDLYGHDGPKTYSQPKFKAHKFNFHDAEDIFRHFYEENPFEDDFFKKFFGRKKSSKTSGSRKDNSSFGSQFEGNSLFSGGFGKNIGSGLFRSQSLFDDDFFGSSLGNKNGFGMLRSPSFGHDFNSDDLDFHPGLTKSVSTTTRKQNGKTVTTTKTTIIKQDGSKQVTQEVSQGGISSKKIYIMAPQSNKIGIQNI